MKTKNWPEGVQCGVALTFDLDAETFWFSRTMDSMASPNLMAEGAYGPKVAVPRILDMLDRLELKATFFIPGWVIEHHTETCREIVRRGHEIGYHGYLHEKAYFVEQENELIAKAKKIMKDLLGVEPVGHRTPEAELTKETIRTIIDNGFEYSTNTMDRDCPYLHELEDGRKIVELPFNWLYDDSSHFSLRCKLRNAAESVRRARCMKSGGQNLTGCMKKAACIRLCCTRRSSAA